MADVALNFSSMWPTIQVAKVVANPTSLQEVTHNLGYPPLAIAFRSNGANADMQAINVDSDKVYCPPSGDWIPAWDFVVIYAVDITQSFDYTSYTSAVGDPIKDDTSGSIDLRKFLLHSRAVGPMLLSVRTKNYTTSDTMLTYTSPLNYPTFQFGYVRSSVTDGDLAAGRWTAAPLASQYWPVLQSDGHTSSLRTTVSNGNIDADMGSIITLRNPAIITNNTTSVTI